MKKTTTIIILLLTSFSVFSQSSEVIVPFFNNGKWGFMNKEKEIIVCPKYDEAYPSYSNRLRVKLGDKYGYIDQMGEVVIKPKFPEAEDFKHGIAKVRHKDNFYFINIEGKENKMGIALCGTHYSCTHPRLSDRISIIESNGKLGIVYDKLIRDENKKPRYLPDTIQPIFDSIIPISNQLMYIVKDSLISFSHEGSYIAGAEYIISNLNFEYEEVKLFNCTLCSEGKNRFIGIKKDGLWGYMKVNFEPHEQIDPKYLNISSLADGFALVEYENGKFGYIDRAGNEYFIR